MLKSDKKKIIYKIKKRLDKSLSIIILGFKNLSTNKLNLLRRNAQKNGSDLMVVRNNLLKICVYKSNFSYLNKYLSGPIILGFSINNYNGLSKVLVKYLNKYKNNLVLKSISLNGREISVDLNKKLSFLFSIKESLKYFIFILKNFFLFRLLRILLIVKDSKY